MATRQLPLFGAQARAKRACFYSLHPSEKTGKFSAYTPKAMVRVRVSPRSRAQPGLVDDIPAVHLRVVPHPRDVHATGRYPWV